MRTSPWLAAAATVGWLLGCDCVDPDGCDECPECQECPRDDDGDGYTAEQGDCDDEDPAVHPRAVEICGDDVDQDCSGDPDDGTTDADGDGYVDDACTGGDDCDDGDPGEHPGASDVCDGLDNDCDGQLDEQTLVVDATGGALYTAIQDAVDASVPGDVICVYPGTYHETVDLQARDVTILGLMGPDYTVVDGGGAGSTFSHTLGDGSALQGLTITGGTGTVFDPDHDGEFDACGGGVFIDASRVEVRDCVIRGNEADDGAGIYVNFGSVQVADCEITDNHSDRYGGAIRLRATEEEIVVESTAMEGNTASTGGAVALYQASATLVDSTLAANVASSNGGAVYAGGGSAITLSSCAVEANEAGGSGGGLRLYNAQGFIGGTVVSGNVAAEAGGGIACRESSMGTSGSTVEGNEPDQVSCDSCDGCSDSR